MLVHGVKGELLTRNRILVPLAAARRECWYFFPRYLSSSSAPIVLRALYRRSGFLLRGRIEPFSTGPRTRAPMPSAMHTCRDVDRILSIEPSASGAGKKAAYDALGRGEADDLAARCRGFGAAPRTCDIATLTRRNARTEPMRCVCAKASRALRDHDGAKRTRARAPVS
jgi:hypothetical protein